MVAFVGLFDILKCPLDNNRNPTPNIKEEEELLGKEVQHSKHNKTNLTITASLAPSNALFFYTIFMHYFLVSCQECFPRPFHEVCYRTLRNYVRLVILPNLQKVIFKTLLKLPKV